MKLEQEREGGDADHPEHEGELDRHADHESDPGREPGATGARQVAADRQFADNGADERPKEQPGQSEEDPRKRAERRADGRACAGAGGA